MRYPDVDDMDAVRASLGSLGNPNKSIWAAARETSQSLEFDLKSRSNPSSLNSSSLPPPPSGAGPTAPQATSAAQIELERRLKEVEAENKQLKKEQAELRKQKMQLKMKSAQPSCPSTSTTSSATTLNPTYSDDLATTGEGEIPDFSDIRQSFEESIKRFSKIEKAHKARVQKAEKKLRESQNEVKELKKSSNEIRQQSKEFSDMFASNVAPPTNTTTPFSKDEETASVTRKKTKSPKRNKSPVRKKESDKDVKSASREQPDFAVAKTKAQRLREAKREAERASRRNDDEENDGPALAGLPTEKKAWSTMGPRPKDPSTIQRVDRQRKLGTEVRAVSPRKSKDFERMTSANTSVEFTVEVGKPVDWSVLMGTNERKRAQKAGELTEDDPSYQEVKDIVSHCRGADMPPPAVMALLDDLLPPPKDPEITKELSFKRKISKLMLGLRHILEKNAEKQVKYVPFNQRCNMHTKDLECILARRALATMAYSQGAQESSNLPLPEFATFIRAFWGENPHRFPLDDIDTRYLWQVCDAGDTALFSDLVFVEPYIERNAFGFEFTQQCWGRPREGVMRLRSAGFEEKLNEEDVPARILYGYCESTVAPPQDWDVNDIKRGTEVPKSQLSLERVYGCLGKTICPNLYETHDGRVVFTAAAVAVVQSVESGAQQFYNNHTDDITCLTVHYKGKIAATGQMGKPCYALVWDIDTLETMYRIGDGYFERMVECLAISPNERYLVGVGGDNNQSLGVFDLHAKDEAGNPCPTMVCENQFTPGVPPMMTFLEWKPGLPGVTFVGIAKGKLLKFFDFEPDKEGAGDENSGVQMLTDRKGIAPRDVRELPCAAWAMDGTCLLTGTDAGDVLIWTGIAITATIKAHGGLKQSIACTSAAFTPEGDKLYTGGADGKLKVWSYPDGELLDTHNMALSRGELASKCGGAEATKNIPKKKDKGIPGAPKAVPKKIEKTIPANKAIKNIIVLDNKKFVKGESKEGYEQVVIGNERGMLLNVWDDQDGNTQFKSMMASHYGEVSGLSPHPFEPGVFATVGEDGILNIWSALEKRILKTSELPHPARNVCWSPDGNWVAVGYCDGYMGIYDTEKLRERVEHHTLDEDIDQIKWSPDGRWLAVGSHDNYIDIFDCKKGFKFRNRFKGHTSYITHIDFSADSRMLASNCGASEILYWDVPNKTQLRARAEMPQDPNDPRTWGRMTCVLGFPVMGIWPDFSDGTDVNALHVNQEGDICVTADDFGEVKLFNFPCVTEDAAFRAYRGHSSFVNNVAFVNGDSHVISCGSADLTVMQWKFTYDVDVLKPIKNAMKLFSGVNAFKTASKGALRKEAQVLKGSSAASKFMKGYGEE